MGISHRVAPIDSTRACWIFKMFALLLLLLSGTRACTRDELEMVQIISLHGTFAPEFTYSEDPNQATVWTEGLNDLTMLGKFQSYALGVLLRNFYKDFITSDPRELEVISSADKGTVKSAQSLATALYAPTPYWEVVQNFTWQPIYIKYDNEDDKFLSDRLCPAAEAEYKKIMLRETEALLQTYQSLMLYWSVNSGMDLKSLVDVEKIFRVLQTEFSHNLTLPEWSKNYWDDMKYLHDVSVSLKAKTKKLKSLQGGPLVDRTIEAMRMKVLNAEDPKKVIVYSTHSSPLLGFLAAMDLGKSEHLPPCASVLVEQYKHEGLYFVRYLLLNSTSPHREPQTVYVLTVPGCSEFCPLNYVIDYTRDVIPKNLDQECLLI